MIPAGMADSRYRYVTVVPEPAHANRAICTALTERRTNSHPESMRWTPARTNQITSADATIKATAGTLTDGTSRSRLASAQVTMLSPKRIRATESGLKSSSGASRANHERVLGKSRLRIWASEDSRVLRTAQV